MTHSDELRVLVTTDVLSEGQNLQDCAIVVNYDLPWAIIRLIQRAGRVDRIGQQERDILCYSFLPTDGVERLLHLRDRVRTRLRQNAEVVGTDEAFFEDEDKQAILDLYNEKAGILDGDDETDVDLSSYAYQIWKNATAADPPLKQTIEDLPPVVYSSRAYTPTTERPEGVLVYLRTAQRNDALAWMDRDGQECDRKPVRDSADRGMPARRAGTVASRDTPHTGPRGDRTRRPRRKTSGRSTRPPLQRPLPCV